MNTIQQVPFELQEDKNGCGPTAIKLILDYLGHKLSLSEINKLTDFKGKNIPTINLAIAAGKLGHKSDFYTSNLIKSCGKEAIQEARASNVRLEENSLTIEQLISYIKKDYLPIVLIDWNIILIGLGQEIDPEISGFRGHFVPLVGYDENNIYIHSHGINNPKEIIKPELAISKDLFDKARKSDEVKNSTDEDIVIIHRKIKDYLSIYTSEKLREILSHKK